MIKTYISIALIAVSALMSACAPVSISAMQGRTSTLTGCPSSSITVTDVDRGMMTVSYTAQCQGKIYYCGGDADFISVTCTEAKK